MTRKTRRRLTAATLCAGIVLLAACSSKAPTPPAATKAAVGKWGIDLDAMDRSAKPGDDFFRYAGGTWMKNTTIQMQPDAKLHLKPEDRVRIW